MPRKGGPPRIPLTPALRRRGTAAAAQERAPRVFTPLAYCVVSWLEPGLLTLCPAQAGHHRQAGQEPEERAAAAGPMAARAGQGPHAPRPRLLLLLLRPLERPRRAAVEVETPVAFTRRGEGRMIRRGERRGCVWRPKGRRG